MEQRRAEERRKTEEIYSLASLIRVSVGTALNGKRFPKYEEVFPQNAEKKEMSDEQMFRTVSQLNGLFGGKQK